MTKKKTRLSGNHFAFFSPYSLENAQAKLNNMPTKNRWGQEKRTIKISDRAEETCRFQITEHTSGTIQIIAKGLMTPESENLTLVTGKIRASLWTRAVILISGCVVISWSIGFIQVMKWTGLCIAVASCLMWAAYPAIIAHERKSLSERIHKHLLAIPIDDDGDYFEEEE